MLAVAVLVVCCVLGRARQADASPTEELKAARASFLAGDFANAAGQLSALLYPTSRLADASAIAEAHLLLGVSYFETNKPEGAEREFEEALFLDSSLSLDQNLFSPRAISFFDKTKDDLAKRADIAKEKERLARKNQALREALENMVVYEKRRYWVNFIPFGAGQFQNGQLRKGVSFFIAEAVTGGASVGLWSYQVIRYGFRGKVPRDEIDRVNTLQILQIGSGALFWAFTAWGIVDSLSNYEHTIKREADPAILKDLEGIFGPSASFRLLPVISPENSGVLLHWEF